MNGDTHTLKAATRWVRNLAKLCRYKTGKLTPEEDIEWKDELALYATKLAAAFPTAAFTTESLDSCIEPFFPPLATVQARLRGWWDANAPIVAPMLPGEHDDLSSKDRSWVGFYFKRQAEISAPGYRPTRGNIQADRDILASLVRSESPKAWARITEKLAPETPPPPAHDDGRWAAYEEGMMG